MGKQQPALIIGGTAIILVVAYFIYDRLRPRCDAIFEQTATRIGASIEVIKNKGELVMGREQVQEFTEGSQKVALHLKTCCVAQQNHAFTAEQFQTCLSAAKDYQEKVQQVTNILKEAEVAKADGNAQLVEQKTVQVKEVVSTLPSSAKRLEAAASSGETAQLPTGKSGFADPPPIRGAEREPNNTIMEANPAEMDSSLSGEIAPANDVDFYKFQYRDSKSRRDIIAVRLDNQSTTLQPSMQVYNEDKSVLVGRISPNVAGANLAFSFSAAPGKTYYVEVASLYNSSAGKYLLSAVPQKAYDQFEPNDDVFTATPTKVGQKLEANIMDGPDVDWYRLSGVKDKSVTVRLENESTTLQPAVRVHNEDKSLIEDWHVPNAAGADVEFSFASEPGKEYYIEVASSYSSSAGKYKLSTH